MVCLNTSCLTSIHIRDKLNLKGDREMNKRFKRIVGILILIMVIAGAFMVRRSAVIESKTVKNTEIEQIKNNMNNKMEITRVLTQSTDDVYLEEGDIFTEFNDGSYTIENPNTGLYLFQAVELGDWDYTVNSKEELSNLVETYKSIKEVGYY